MIKVSGALTFTNLNLKDGSAEERRGLTVGSHRFPRAHGLVLDRSKKALLLVFLSPAAKSFTFSLALAEIRLAIATLFRRFEFSLPRGAKLNKRYHGFVSYLDRPGLPLQCKPKEE